MAGRAFADQRATTAERDEGVRVWVPIVEGSDRTGVLALTVPVVDDEVLRACEELGLFVGYLVATQSRSTDLFNLHRRRRSLSLGASMQWDLLPPLVLRTERLTVAGLLEPAYEVAGDCFDYALNASILDLAVFDPMGHGITSALMAALCVGSYRHDRREGQSLEQFDLHLESSVAAHFPDAFVTGQLVRLDLDTGTMTWINGGHPLPMLIRGGRVIDELEAPPDLPWGMAAALAGGRAPVVPSTVRLEPGDSVLFYTDGVVEARLPDGEQFGPQRLADVAGQHASDQLEPEEFVRRLVRAVVEYQADGLGDDATLVLVTWHGSGR
jgi:serine phosphatase RsbU (regulator of sigma subunit)